MARPVVMYMFPLIHGMTYVDLCHVLRSDPASGAKHEVATSKQVVCVWWDFYASHEEEGEPRKIRLRCPRKNCRMEITLRRGTFF